MKDDKLIANFRIDLRRYQDDLEAIDKYLQKLCKHKSNGMKYIDDNGVDILPDLIQRASDALLTHKKCVIAAEARLNLAIAGDY